MKERKAVLFKEGNPTHQMVGTRPNGEFYPYVMFADDLYVRSEQSDQHENGLRIPAYMCAEYYEVC